MSLDIQFLTLTVMAGCGIAMGICFDTAGAIVREFRLHRSVQALFDLVYWAAATYFVFKALLYANYGEVRVFIFIGLAMGILLYALLVGSWYRKLTVQLLRMLKAIFLYMVRIVRMLIIRPLLFLYRMLVKIVLITAGFVATVSVFLAKVVLQWGRMFWNWIRARFARGKE